jgi:hypothetical protein
MALTQEQKEIGIQRMKEATEEYNNNHQKTAKETANRLVEEKKEKRDSNLTDKEEQERKERLQLKLFFIFIIAFIIRMS